MTRLERDVLVALRSGPLYRPALQLIVAAKDAELRRALIGLVRDGFVENATDIGRATYRLTTAGKAEVE